MGISKILVVGATGYLGPFITTASVRLGHPTFALVRPATARPDSSKNKLIEAFKASGTTILEGDIQDHESCVAALKQVDVVISTLGAAQIGDQLKLITAIKEVGHITRFIPSDFGNDPERSVKLKPTDVSFLDKIEIHNAIKAAGIPYTFVNSNCFASFILGSWVFRYESLFSGSWVFSFSPSPGQHELKTLPRDKVTILGDGNAKAIYNSEEDIGTFTIKAVDDPRTLNKQLMIRPELNIKSMNEVVQLWENKIGHSLDKTYVPESEVLKQIEEMPFPNNFFLALSYSFLVKGEQYFEPGPDDVEASELYPDIKYTTVDEFLNRYM
ncbi:unnamed protein product [Sphagnum jensenii]|uniref:NmrA-like domain-containing protein n=1 Tax=Sphagnum jensenii TaxID=128206 RepID=A0ABP1BV14_9BRYO